MGGATALWAAAKGSGGHGTPLTVTNYPGTRHWFFEKSRTAYHPEAAEIAWEATLQFLRRTLNKSVAC